MAKSIFDDAKKWPEFQEPSEEPQGIYRPLYYAVKAVEEAVKIEVAKAEPPPTTIKPRFTDFRSYEDVRRLSQWQIALRKSSPDLDTLVVRFDMYYDVELTLTECPLCKETHSKRLPALVFLYLEASRAIIKIKEALVELQNQCSIELGPAGASK